MPPAFRDPSIPSLDSFEALVKESDFSDFSGQLMRALRGFEQDLNLEHKAHDLTIFKADPDFMGRIRPSRYRFFFNPALTYDQGIVLTVFLEAKPQELAERKGNYSNANKHLYNAFLSEDGLIRKVPSAFQRDLEIASTTEHTAYAKFYLKKLFRGGKFAGISILMHPFQSARLIYDPSKDPQYSKFKDRAEIARKKVLYTINRLIREGNSNQSGLTVLNRIRELIEQLKNNVYKQGDTFERAIVRLSELSHSVESKFMVYPPTKERPIIPQVPGKKQRPAMIPLRKILLRLIADASHVRNMHSKRGKEVQYSSAEKHSGEFREALLLYPSLLLKRRLEKCFGKPAYRYVLSTEQIRRIRLTGEKGNIRERIMSIPRLFETTLGRPVKMGGYPVQYVDSKGKVHDSIISQKISFVRIDSRTPSRARPERRAKRKQQRQNRRSGRR